MLETQRQMRKAKYSVQSEELKRNSERRKARLEGPTVAVAATARRCAAPGTCVVRANSWDPYVLTACIRVTNKHATSPGLASCATHLRIGDCPPAASPAAGQASQPAAAVGLSLREAMAQAPGADLGPHPWAWTAEQQALSSAAGVGRPARHCWRQTVALLASPSAGKAGIRVCVGC